MARNMGLWNGFASHVNRSKEKEEWAEAFSLFPRKSLSLYLSTKHTTRATWTMTELPAVVAARNVHVQIVRPSDI